MRKLIFLGVLLPYYTIRCQEDTQKLETKIVGGRNSQIIDFPHSVFLGAYCYNLYWGCGASILNQYILLTAAHCLDGCNTQHCSIIVKCGSASKQTGIKYDAKRYVIHPEYDEKDVSCDVGLVLLKSPLQFGENVRRVAIMRNPPYYEKQEIAGWGRIDEIENLKSVWLQHISQTTTRREPCETIIGSLPLGVFCGGAVISNSYAAIGDSGSALVSRKYIQTGIVSFKRVEFTRSLVVYSDVGYYYDWIKENAISLFCMV